MNYGTDLKLKTNKMAKGFGGGMDVKGRDKPRAGAAMGQGMGMGGMDRARISKAMMEIPGMHGGKPEFYCGGRKD
ncbi:hypothetical protein UFOVP98_43 [uncultured Caudovirales phage]|uniref:Uncharacterized protein n=1 Tax=uncultured Caudovirales phage TaxID=2100421 RepID=A0A6J5LMT9_9CAUD|nr:hypothetical protein UFOVP98_43 [uncultured Caudovirales phage]CAB4134246.1 hypothetical protein UFOVP269_27 [uncultured Caudovirales phage]